MTQTHYDIVAEDIIVPLTCDDGSMLDETKIRDLFKKHNWPVHSIQYDTNQGLIDEWWCIHTGWMASAVIIQIYREHPQCYYYIKMELMQTDGHLMEQLTPIIKELSSGLGIDNMDHAMGQFTPAGTFRLWKKCFPWERLQGEEDGKV